MSVRTAQVIYVGDAASMIAASQAAADAVTDGSKQIADANSAIADSYGEALLAAQEAGEAAAAQASLVGGTLDDQQAAYNEAAEAISGANARIAESAAEAGQAAADAAAKAGASLDDQQAAYAEAADAATAWATDVQAAAEIAGEAAAAQTAAIGGTLDDQKAAYAEAADAAAASAEEQRAALAAVDEAAEVSAGVVTDSSTEASGAFAEMGAGLTSVIPGWKAIGIAITAAAVESIKMSIDFEQSMTRVQTEAGASAKEVAYFSQEIEKMAGHTEQTDSAMAEGIYWIASAGLKGSEAIDALKTSNELADVSGAHLAETAKTVSTVIVDLRMKTSEYHDIAGEVNATVGAGKMTLEEYNKALGSGLLAAAAASGVGFSEVNAGLATLTRLGIPATRAATGLRQAFQKLGSLKEENTKGELTAAGEALHYFGLTADGVSEQLRKPDGFLNLVDELHTKLESMHGAAESTGLRDILEMAGGVKSGTQLQALVEHPQELQKANDEILQNNADFHAKLVQQEETLQAEIDKAWSAISNKMNEAGHVIAPALAVALKAAYDKIALATRELGPVFSAVFTDVENVFKDLAAGTAAAFKSMEGVGKAFAAVFTLNFSQMWSGIEQAFSSGLQAAEDLLKAATQPFIEIGKSIVDGLKHGIESGAHEVGNAAKNLAKEAENAIGIHLGIGSPSKVTHKMGEQTAEGFANGLTSKTPMAVAAATSMTQQIMSFFEQHGFSKAAAAGIAGNAQLESSDDPNAPGGGLFQTIGGRGAGQGASVQAQLESALREILARGEKGGLNAAGSAAEAARYFETHFERPEGYNAPGEGGTAHSLQRENAATAAYGGGSGTVSAETTAERAARKAAEEHERKLAKDAEAGQKELNAILGAIHGGKLTELNTVLHGAHERGLVQLEHTLSGDHTAALSKLDAELVAAHTKALTSLAEAVVREWNTAVAALTSQIGSLVEKATAAFTKAAEKATSTKYTAAIEGIEANPNTAAIRADKEATEAETTKREEVQLKKRVKETKGSGNKEEQEIAEEALTQFYRRQDEKRREKQEEEERRGAESSRRSEETSLEARTKSYESMLSAQLGALEKQLTAGKIKVEQFTKEVNAILAGAGPGISISISASAAGTLGAPPSGVPIIASEHAQPISRASGGPVYAGQVYQVGEVGRETFVPHSDGHIIPAGRRSMGGITNHFHGPIHMASKRSADQFAHKMAHKMRFGGH